MEQKINNKKKYNIHVYIEFLKELNTKNFNSFHIQSWGNNVYTPYFKTIHGIKADADENIEILIDLIEKSKSNYLTNIKL